MWRVAILRLLGLLSISRLLALLAGLFAGTLVRIVAVAKFGESGHLLDESDGLLAAMP